VVTVTGKLIHHSVADPSQKLNVPEESQLEMVQAIISSCCKALEPFPP
jgi:hypothetical protein